MNTAEPFNPFAPNAKEESLKRMKIVKQQRKQRETKRNVQRRGEEESEFERQAGQNELWE